MKNMSTIREEITFRIATSYASSAPTNLDQALNAIAEEFRNGTVPGGGETSYESRTQIETIIEAAIGKTYRKHDVSFTPSAELTYAAAARDVSEMLLRGEADDLDIEDAAGGFGWDSLAEGVEQNYADMQRFTKRATKRALRDLYNCHTD